MHPILFHIGNFPVRSFGVMLMIAFLVAIIIASKRAPRFGLTPLQIQDGAVWIIILGVLFARITFIAQEWGSYQGRPQEIFKLQMDGLTSFGGLFGGALGVLIYSKLKHFHPLQLLDAIGVPMLVASAIGRIGCLLNGCCYGHACLTSPPGVVLHDAHGGILRGPHGEGFFLPAQLIDSALALVGAVVISRLERRPNWPRGLTVGLTFVAYGLARFIYEYFRAGSSSVLFPNSPVTHAQLAAFALALVGTGISLWARRRPMVEVS